MVMSSTYEKDLTKRLWNSIETPTHFVTVKPMTPGIEVIDMDTLLDTTNYQLLRQAFGSSWKYQKRRPKWFLFPEQSSRKTTRNSYELLHMHGVVQIESKELQWWYRNHFSYLFAKNVNEFRGDRFKDKHLEQSEVQFDPYDHSKDARGYTLKHHTVGFDHEDAYVFGRESKT